MKTVWKYPLRIDEASQAIPMPKRAKILYAGLDPKGNSCVWAVVDTELAVETVTVHIRGTGHPLPPDVRHVGSIQQGEFIGHVFV
jgi:hypothetical protein